MVRVNKFKKIFFIAPVLVCIFLAFIFLSFPMSTYPETSNEVVQDTFSSKLSSGKVGDLGNSYKVSSISIEIPKITTINIPEGYTLNLNSALPKFIDIQGDHLNLSATKNDGGIYKIYLNDLLGSLYNETFFIELNLFYKSVDTNEIENQIKEYLGPLSQEYGYFVYDLNREIDFGLNADENYRAASMVKVPIAIAILREVQEGSLSLETIYPLKDNLVFNYVVGAGVNSAGYPYTIKDYLEFMIIESDNTSLNHLVMILVDKYGSAMNDRLKQITGVDFYVNPPEATPRNVATVLKGLYNHSFINQEYSEYLINTMKNALPDLKEGIGLGLPENIEFANKIGFLNTNEDLSYMDSAIVFGSSTDYVIVIMNKNQPWDFAQQNIKNISSIIYKNLN